MWGGLGAGGVDSFRVWYHRPYSPQGGSSREPERHVQSAQGSLCEGGVSHRVNAHAYRKENWRRQDERLGIQPFSCRRATGGGVSGALVSVLHLKWYINTMHVGRYGMLDKRVFHRMCCTLQQRYKGYDNFFRTLLTQNELEIIDYVATQSKQLLPRLLATFFHQHIAFSPLLFFRFWRSLG